MIVSHRWEMMMGRCRDHCFDLPDRPSYLPMLSQPDILSNSSSVQHKHYNPQMFQSIRNAFDSDRGIPYRLLTMIMPRKSLKQISTAQTSQCYETVAANFELYTTPHQKLNNSIHVRKFHLQINTQPCRYVF